jgi:hypothetical protein
LGNIFGDFFTEASGRPVLCNKTDAFWSQISGLTHLAGSLIEGAFDENLHTCDTAKITDIYFQINIAFRVTRLGKFFRLGDF